MKIVLSHALNPAGMALLEREAEVFVAGNDNPNNYLDQMADADGIILRIAQIDRHAIEHSPRLKVIAKVGVGYDTIDVQAATEAGIPVVITPGANNRSVAEHTLAMMLAASKNLIESHTGTLAGDYAKVRTMNKAFEVLGKKAGFVGLGAIGREAAKLCRGVGMETLAFDPYLNREQVEEAGCTWYADYETLLEDSDFVSLHVPLTGETRGMIGYGQLSRMKKTAVIVNCARGGIVDEADLARALNEGVIAGAAMDVFVTEPPPPDYPLFSAKNLICSPHSAAQTREAVLAMHTMCARGALSVIKGEKCMHIANKDVYNHPRWAGK